MAVFGFDLYFPRVRYARYAGESDEHYNERLDRHASAARAVRRYEDKRARWAAEWREARRVLEFRVLLNGAREQVRAGLAEPVVYPLTRRERWGYLLVALRGR